MPKYVWVSGIVALVVSFGYFQQSTLPSPAPTFYKDVLPILQDHCQSCHRPGEVAPMPLVTYEQTRPLAGAIAHAVEAKMMPPWFADARFGHFSNDPSLTAHEISTISAWAAASAPAGQTSDAPPPKQWTDGWNIAQPDLVVKMPKPVPIPAKLNTRTRSCPQTLRWIAGSGCRSFAPEVRPTYTMRWSIYVRPIHNGFDMHLSASLSRHPP